MRAPLPCLLLCSCMGWRECPPVAHELLGRLPDRLSQSGLYTDLATRELSPSALPFAPRFELWSDGSQKSRWIELPDGATIDASDPDSWRFPTGTRAWKEFRRDGRRIETRLIEKIGDGEWAAVAYRWEEDESEAWGLPEGEERAGIPSAEDCVACHGGRKSFLLGFSAVQLHEAEGLDLERLVADGIVQPDPGPISVPGERNEQALGYLHANCSHCHNPERDVGEGRANCYDPFSELDLMLPARALPSVRKAPALRTGERLISPGEPEDSELLSRISTRRESNYPYSMPPLGTEQVDGQGVAMLRAWIGSL